ncbi:MAG: ABC transporter permease [Demequinaceae bacterium]|nr:ABC transporter permease [Demequinaceae bacterium]
MPFSRKRAIARTSIRILANDPAPTIVMIAMPLILAAFLKPAMAAQLQAQGFSGANGAEQVIPGLAVMFAFLSTQVVSMLFYREHYWGTWERLRATGASASDVMIGKAVPLFFVMMVQLVVVFGAGGAFFGYRINGSFLALGALVAGLVAAVIGYAVMVVAIFKTLDQAMVIGNLGGMLMAGLGGALAPAASMPGWAQAAAHLSPAYWGLEGIRDVTLGHAGLVDVAGALVALTVFTVCCGLIAAIRFRPTEAKIGTT